MFRAATIVAVTKESRREMKHTFPDSTHFSQLKRRKINKERLPTPVIERLALIPLVIPLFIGAAVVAVLS